MGHFLEMIPIMCSLFRSVLAVGLALAIATGPARAEGISRPSAESSQIRVSNVLPGEFEPQDAVMLAWDGDSEVVRVQIEIVAAIWRTTRVLMLVGSAQHELAARSAFVAAGIPWEAVRYVHVPVDTIWTRDYGPVVVRSSFGPNALVDADYSEEDRPNDDNVPAAVAPILDMLRIRAPLAVDGGNLLSNGAGLCIATHTLLDENTDRGYDEPQVTDMLKKIYGANQIVFLDPIIGESNGHVDMFATFASVDTVVIGEYSSDDNPANASVLNRNADRLTKLTTPNGPLKVVRIPMPPLDVLACRTYTNVVYANETLLVPTYPGFDAHCRGKAFAVYRRLLPSWTIIGVNCNDLILSSGAIHCMTMNLSAVTRMPELPGLWPNPIPLSALPEDAISVRRQMPKALPSGELQQVRRRTRSCRFGSSFRR